MQLTNTTDYAIRIVCYLAGKEEHVQATQLSKQLKIPVSYIPKITKQLKRAGLVVATEGVNGGYQLAKNIEDISLMDVIACAESTISDLVKPGRDEYYGRFYTILKVDLEHDTYECVYSHCKEVKNEIKTCKNYKTFLDHYQKKFVHTKDQEKIKQFLSYENLQQESKNGCIEEDISYRRRNALGDDSYTWMGLKKYIDADEKTAILTLHNAKVIPNTMIQMEQELQKREKDISKQYWDMVSLLVSVLNHNNLLEPEHQDDISFYTKQVYLQLKENYPEYQISDEEIENVSHLAPIHDIGKIRVPMEILKKNGKLTDAEMDIVKEHPIIGAEMTLRFPRSFTTQKLNQYSYDICKYHHERYDGSGYPDGLKGEEIPICAQVVGLVDAYDALINERPYKRKLKHETAIRMILNGECGMFSDEILTCFLAAVMQPEWKKKVRDLNEKEKEVHKTDHSTDLVYNTSKFTIQYDRCRSIAK